MPRISVSELQENSENHACTQQLDIKHADLQILIIMINTWGRGCVSAILELYLIIQSDYYPTKGKTNKANENYLSVTVHKECRKMTVSLNS